MRQSYRLIINVLSNYATLFIFGLVNFVLMGYMVRKLGEEAFGVICLVLSLTVITEIMGTGFSAALTKHMSAAVNAKNYLKSNRLINSGLLCFAVCGIIGGLIILVLSFFVDKLFDIPHELLFQTKWAILLLALRSVICFPFNAIRGALFAHQRYDLVNISKATTILLRLLLIVLYFEFISIGLISLVVITILTLLIERSMWLFFLAKAEKNLSFKLSLLSRKAIRTLFNFSAFILIISVSNMIGYHLVKWIIGLELNMLDVGGYTLIASLGVFVGNLTRAISGVLIPVSSRYETLDLSETNRKLAYLATKCTMILGCGLCVLPVFLLKPFLTLWVGESYTSDYLSRLAFAAVFLLIGQCFISMEVCLRQMLVGIGKIRIPAAITISWALGGTLSVWICLRWMQSSLLTAVGIISLARILGSLAHLSYGIWKFNLSPIKFVFRAIVKPMIAGIIVCLSSWWLIGCLNMDKAMQFIMGTLILILLYIIVTWMLVLSSDERTEVFSELGAAVSKLRV